MHKEASGVEKVAPDTIEVLLVDDHLPMREEIRLLLSRQGGIKIVGEAGSGEEAVQKARELKPRLVVMDIALPGMTGVEATRLIKFERPSTVILALSNYSSKALVQSIMEAGAIGYVRKDRSFEELVPAILSVVAGNRYLGKDIQEP